MLVKENIDPEVVFTLKVSSYVFMSMSDMDNVRIQVFLQDWKFV